MVEPELKQAEYATSDTSSALVEPTSPDILIDQVGTLAPMSTSSEGNEQWREIGEKAYAFLASLPEYVGKFFSEYRQPLVTLGLIFGSIVSVKLTLALLGAINDVPLLQPTFELIGLVYTVWFTYRYLLKASNRQELGEDFDKLKSQVMGK